MRPDPELDDLIKMYGVPALLISITLASMIPAGLALFWYTMDWRWLLMCLPLLMFL